MRARVGDRIILAADKVDQPTREGTVTEVRGPDGQPPFVVEWSNGHTGLLYPGPGAILRITGPDEDAAPVPVAADGRAADGADHREWVVRLSITGDGDDTSATAVLLADAAGEVSASGDSHRSGQDPPTPGIGAEVAAARALRHLADRLMAVAETEVGQQTGEDVHIRRS
jgi:hypothetical protein